MRFGILSRRNFSAVDPSHPKTRTANPGIRGDEVENNVFRQDIDKH